MLCHLRKVNLCFPFLQTNCASIFTHTAVFFLLPNAERFNSKFQVNTPIVNTSLSPITYPSNEANRKRRGRKTHPQITQTRLLPRTCSVVKLGTGTTLGIPPLLQNLTCHSFHWTSIPPPPDMDTHHVLTSTIGHAYVCVILIVKGLVKVTLITYPPFKTT